MVENADSLMVQSEIIILSLSYKNPITSLSVTTRRRQTSQYFATSSRQARKQENDIFKGSNRAFNYYWTR